MTYDERQEIGEWLDIVKKNCERTLRSIELMQNALGGMTCTLGERGENDEEPAESEQPSKLLNTDISMEEEK